MYETKEKDPQDTLDYVFDFAKLTNDRGESDWLESGDTINTYTITADTGITVDSDSKTDTSTSITVWLSGGTVSKEYNIVCKIVTVGGRTKSKTGTIKIIDQ